MNKRDWKEVIIILMITLGAGLYTYSVMADTPNPKFTHPVWRTIVLRDICATKWGKDVRHVTPAMRKQVAAWYGPFDGRSHELDHSGPRCLGGADDPVNLWPQSWAGSCNAHQKDHLEVYLCKRICAANDPTPLDTARSVFASDWRKGYARYIDSKGC